MGSDEVNSSEAKRILKIIIALFLFIWVVQLVAIVFKLLGFIAWDWLWVFAISWGSLLFWFVLVGGILFFDFLGKG